MFRPDRTEQWSDALDSAPEPALRTIAKSNVDQFARAGNQKYSEAAMQSYRNSMTGILTERIISLVVLPMMRLRTREWPYGREWPTWRPPSEMIDRQPELEPYRRGMDLAPDNPLGLRALYIHQGSEDTLYRLHGNMDARSIGQAVSSGCVRLLFQDIIDLYSRVTWGAPIVVVQ